MNTETVWDVIGDTAPIRRGFDSDDAWSCVAHFAIGAEMVGPLDADRVRGSLVSIANQASWAACRCCDPAAGRDVRQEIWDLTRRLEYAARRLGEELLRYEAGDE